METSSILNYLQRIKHEPKIDLSWQTLAALQKSHLLNIPFENLDIHNDIPIKLDIDQVFEKIVNQNRGGFCYELNGLFSELLLALGFETRIISARVFDHKNGFGPEFDHLALIVTIEQIDFLVDVGFGEFSFFPLKIELGTVQNDPRGDFVISQYDDKYLQVSKLLNGSPSPEYIFTKKVKGFSEFTDMCHYHQTSPLSHFTQKKLITRPTENGRITLTSRLLKIRTEEGLEEYKIETEDEFKHNYNHFFLKKISYWTMDKE